MEECLEHAIRKAQIITENVVAVFFVIDKAYDMMWTDGLLNKRSKLGFQDLMHRWSNFLNGRSAKVRIGKCYSRNIIEQQTHAKLTSKEMRWKNIVDKNVPNILCRKPKVVD